MDEIGSPHLQRKLALANRTDSCAAAGSREFDRNGYAKSAPADQAWRVELSGDSLPFESPRGLPGSPHRFPMDVTAQDVLRLIQEEGIELIDLKSLI